MISFSPNDLYPLLKNPPEKEKWKQFLSRIDLDPSNIFKCWSWKGSTSRGYGQTSWLGKNTKTHRLMSIWLYGALPKTLVSDHIVCSNTLCCNPLHLIPHSQQFNLMRPGAKGFGAINKRKTHCINGHEFSETNTVLRHGNHRRCRICWIYQGRRKKNDSGLTKP